MKDHVVVVKRKNHLPERYLSSGTAVQADANGWIVTITDTTQEEKKAMKIVLSYSDRFKFEKMKKA